MDKKIKIVVLGPALTAVSGVSTHLNQLFSSTLGEEVIFLHFQVGSEGRQETTLQKLVRFLTSPVAFAAYLLRQKPHIVHFNTSLDFKAYWRDTLYLAVARLLRRKVIYQVHGGALPDEFFAGNAALTWLLRRVLSLPDVVVLLAQVELAAYQKFVPEQNLEVVANAIDAAALSSGPIHARHGTPLQLTYLGRLAVDKGIFESIEALAILIRKGRDLRLTIAGDGPEEGSLKGRVAELGLAKHVVFQGPLFGVAKNLLWLSTDVFVFPTYREGLPYSLLEAMAAGAVPITTRVGAIPDVMQDGIHGLLIEAKDPVGLARAIERLDDDRVCLEKMAVAGRARLLEAYTMARLTGDFRRLYADLARES